MPLASLILMASVNKSVELGYNKHRWLISSCSKPFELGGRVNFLRANLFPFVIWIEVSILAIAFIGNRPYLGLAIAVLGGVALGLIAIKSYESVYHEGADRENDEADILGKGNACIYPNAGDRSNIWF